MGGSSWNPDDYVTRQTTRASTGTSAFAHSAAIKSGRVAAKIHDNLNPKGVIRECRDSDAHPETLPIITLFDVTGSMGSIPEVLQKKLGQLMGTIIGNGYADHPQILFGAIGDSYSDNAPLQVGQFENGIELDDDLSRIWVEGGGGGQMKESYALAHYFAAKKTSTDAWEKRGKKGYLFTMGDEMCHDLSRKELAEVFGDNVESSISVKDAIALASEKYEVFHIVVAAGSYNGTDPQVMKYWKDILGERALFLDDPNAVCETIASTIGVLEGRVDLDSVVDDLVKAGASKSAAVSASKAVSVFTNSSGAVTKASASGSISQFTGVGTSGVTKL